MAEQSISDRLVFKQTGVQKAFLAKVKSHLSFSWVGLANTLKLNPRTLADWYREKFRMSLKFAAVMSEISGVRIPPYRIIDLKDHLKNISFKGGQALIKKQGFVSINESYRKEKWQEWWQTKGKFNKNIIRLQTAKRIKIPVRKEELAEFVGIMLGDGTVAPYHIAITLHASVEGKYADFITKLIKKLFGTKSNIYSRKNMDALDVVVPRKRLVDFCQTIGLVKGSKIIHRAIIPAWIMRDKNLLAACVRGLIDTDGSIFEHKYLSRGKMYQYKKISFASGSPYLLRSMEQALKNLGFNVRITRNRKEMVMASQRDVKKYIDEIGTHNPLRLKQTRKVVPNGKATVC